MPPGLQRPTAKSCAVSYGTSCGTSCVKSCAASFTFLSFAAPKKSSATSCTAFCTTPFTCDVQALYFKGAAKSMDRGANGAAMPTDEDDQDGHFFFNQPERGDCPAA